MAIKIVAILGTSRPGSYTEKALAVVTDELGKHQDVDFGVIDPAELDLPFPGRDDGTGDAEMLREKVEQATGIIMATPEYHGSFSSMLKLIIENLGFPSTLRGKPMALLGVAAGRIGAIKSLEQLRSVCSHVGAIVLPAPISVSRVRRVFDERGRCTDPEVERQLRGVATALIDYMRGAVCPKLALEEMLRQETA
jgi:FMN reductase